MKTKVALSCLLLSAVTSGSALGAEDAASHGQVIGGQVVGMPLIGGNVSVADLIDGVSKKTHKTFIVDPSVPAQIRLIGQSPAAVGLNELGSILSAYGFVLVEQSEYVKVLPIAFARMQASPVVLGKDLAPDDKVVTSLIHMKNASASMQVPILRPLLPQWAHLAADVCSNNLLIVDTAANVKRIAAIAQALDVGEPYKAKEPCATPGAPAAAMRDAR